MSVNIANNAFHSIRSNASQLAQGKDLTETQRDETKQAANVLEELSGFITENPTAFEQSELYGSLITAGRTLSEINQLRALELPKEHQEILSNCASNIARYIETSNHALRTMENSNSTEHTAFQGGQPPMVNRSGFDAGIDAVTTVAGVAAGVTALGAKATTEVAKHSVNSMRDSLDAGMVAAGVGIEAARYLCRGISAMARNNGPISKDDIQTAMQVDSNTQPDQPHSGSSRAMMPVKEDNTPDIEAPIQSFDDFNRAQREADYASNAEVLMDTFRLAEQLSRDPEFSESDLGKATDKVLDEALEQFEKSGEQLDSSSLEKFSSFNSRLKECLESEAFDDSASEKLQKALKEVVERIKGVLSKLLGKDNDKSQAQDMQ